MADTLQQNAAGDVNAVEGSQQQGQTQQQQVQQTQPQAQGAGANGTFNQGAAAGAQGSGRPSFDEMLKDGYQAEFDRRVAKAIQTAQGRFSDPQVAELKAQLDGYIRKEAALRAGIAPEFVDFVAYEVGRGLPEGGKFEDALKTFIEAHGQFKAGQPGGAWSQPMQQQDGGAQAEDGVTAAFRKLNPDLKL